MAKVVRGVDSYKKEFLSIFNSLCGRHGRWEVWSDFIQLTAIDISNVTDKANAPKRAADARNIAKKYSEDEIKRMAEMLMQMVYAIDEKPDQDFLGELYMTCELGNDHAGQFFTPYNVCQAMSEISFDPARFEDIGFVSVNDCACGAGALLVSFANVCKRHDINYQQKVMFVAQDIDYTVPVSRTRSACVHFLSPRRVDSKILIIEPISFTSYSIKSSRVCKEYGRIWRGNGIF